MVNNQNLLREVFYWVKIMTCQGCEQRRQWLRKQSERAKERMRLCLQRLTAWLGSIDLAFWFSILIAIAGLIMNWYYARKKDKRDELEHKAYLESLKDKCNVKQD